MSPRPGTLPTLHIPRSHGIWTKATSLTHSDTGSGLFKPNHSGPGQPTSRGSVHGDLGKPPRSFCGDQHSHPRNLEISPRKSDRG